MQRTVARVLVLVFFSCFCLCYDLSKTEKLPTIGIAVLVRNKARSLPYFLSCIYNLDYPKDRVYLWIHSDYNSDNSTDYIKEFVEKVRKEYADIYVSGNDDQKLHHDERVPTNWTPARLRHVINLREGALDFARYRWADMLLMVDADVFITKRDALKMLVKKNETIVAPMLVTDGFYANFWCGMTTEYYYKRTDDYDKIRTGELVGCHSVPMVHSAVLINMRRDCSDFLTYDNTRMVNYYGPEDDIISFAMSASFHDIEMYICNDAPYGFLQVPLEDGEDPAHEEDQLLNTKLEAISRGFPLPVHPKFSHWIRHPTPTKFGLGNIYLINLERRYERYQLMMESFKELGMDVQVFRGVDGKKLNFDKLPYKIQFMPDYEDPYHKRPMKKGEIGCFLSHYSIWRDIADRGIDHALILEDDVHFLPYFKRKFLALMAELEDEPWDLVYIGRKILKADSEPTVTPSTVRPGYSYWTLGYVIRLQGAIRLLEAKPLDKLLPVDEFLPIMFDQHPNDTWKSFFPRRNLLALSASPLLIEPTHYTGEEGYISDTEDSPIIDPNDQPEAEIKVELADEFEVDPQVYVEPEFEVETDRKRIKKEL